MDNFPYVKVESHETIVSHVYFSEVLLCARAHTNLHVCTLDLTTERLIPR